jgi:hypothetical protein
VLSNKKADITPRKAEKEEARQRHPSQSDTKLRQMPLSIALRFVNGRRRPNATTTTATLEGTEIEAMTRRNRHLASPAPNEAVSLIRSPSTEIYFIVGDIDCK